MFFHCIEIIVHLGNPADIEGPEIVDDPDRLFDVLVDPGKHADVVEIPEVFCDLGCRILEGRHSVIELRLREAIEIVELLLYGLREISEISSLALHAGDRSEHQEIDQGRTPMTTKIPSDERMSFARIFTTHLLARESAQPGASSCYRPTAPLPLLCQLYYRLLTAPTICFAVRP